MQKIEVINEETQNLIITAYERTKSLLTEHRTESENLAALILKNKILEKEDLESILGKRELEALA